MADIDIDPFGKKWQDRRANGWRYYFHSRRKRSANLGSRPWARNIIWRSLESFKTGYLKEKIDELYKILFERLQQNSEGIDFKKFEISHGELYF